MHEKSESSRNGNMSTTKKLELIYWAFLILGCINFTIYFSWNNIFPDSFWIQLNLICAGLFVCWIYSLLPTSKAKNVSNAISMLKWNSVAVVFCVFLLFLRDFSAKYGALHPVFKIISRIAPIVIMTSIGGAAGAVWRLRRRLANDSIDLKSDEA